MVTYHLLEELTLTKEFRKPAVRSGCSPTPKVRDMSSPPVPGYPAFPFWNDHVGQAFQPVRQSEALRLLLTTEMHV